MPENVGESRTREFFEFIGFQVERIPEVGHEKRADYWVDDSQSLYLVEAKERKDDSEYIKALYEDGEAYREDELGPNALVAAIIKDAVKQIVATPKKGDCLNVISFVSLGTEPQVYAEQFRSTLMGTVDIVYEMKEGAAKAKPCFYYGFSKFFDFKEIDAALVFLGKKVQLLTNCFSTKMIKLRNSKLYKLLDEHSAVCDPDILEGRGEAFIADCTFSRHKKQDVENYVKDKYKLDAMIALDGMTHYAATVFIPK
jgi:hypothetical protein